MDHMATNMYARAFAGRLGSRLQTKAGKHDLWRTLPFVELIKKTNSICKTK